MKTLTKPSMHSFNACFMVKSANLPSEGLNVSFKCGQNDNRSTSALADVPMQQLEAFTHLHEVHLRQVILPIPQPTLLFHVPNTHHFHAIHKLLPTPLASRKEITGNVDTMVIPLTYVMSIFKSKVVPTTVHPHLRGQLVLAFAGAKLCALCEARVKMTWRKQLSFILVFWNVVRWKNDLTLMQFKEAVQEECCCSCNVVCFFAVMKCVVTVIWSQMETTPPLKWTNSAVISITPLTNSSEVLDQKCLVYISESRTGGWELFSHLVATCQTKSEPVWSRNFSLQSCEMPFCETVLLRIKSDTAGDCSDVHEPQALCSQICGSFSQSQNVGTL